MKIVLFFFFICIQLTAQTEADACQTLSQIKEKIKEYHLKPKPIDDRLSAFVFDTFLEDLDSGNDLFIASEINTLKIHKLKIDNYINSKNCNFLNDFFKTYEKAINRRKKIINDLTLEVFPFESNEQIIFQKKNRPHLNSEIDLKKLFKKRMLFDVLKDISETSKNKDSIKNNFENIAQKSKQKIFDNYSCEANNYNAKKVDFFEQFYSVFCTYFDPHTNYFSKNEKTKFLSSLSSDNFTFGLDFVINDKNQILIADLTPGGPAYFSDEIEINDELIKIKSTDEIDVNCKNFDAIGKLLSSNDIRNITFTFRKKNGKIYSVKLIKQLQKDYQNSVYSYILEEDNFRMGYIKIPSFYATLENGKTNVSDDVKKEIGKLKDDNISSLIIDLENNGGGSMQEAIKLCGLFLKTIYIAQEIDKSRTKAVIGNEKYKPIFTGPIVILINGYSASASEFFTNAMQDYNVAVVVGTKSFGKATIQQIIPLNNKEEEFIKITLGKFYRVTGKTNQYIGITPDIEITNLFDDVIERESKYKTAIKSDFVGSVINLNEYPKNEKQKLAIANFNKSSKTNLELLKNITEKNNFNRLYNEQLKPISLNFTSIFDNLEKANKNWKQIEDYTKSTYPFVVLNTSYDLNLMKINCNLKLISEKKIEDIKINFRVYESINIMKLLN